uniref:Phospholipase A2 inhibitor-like n=1 Tax=Phallusia mammillata TaxID=59560 RepID=A0A6F9D6Q1_9ASCI|nr:phospholipase A2 inhibitor-like [Phallusia mammillata]
MNLVCVTLIVLSLFMSVSGCPLGCECLKDKNLASCTSAEFDSVPKGFPTYITEISLVDNNIQTLRGKAFQWQLPLIKLDMSENSISDINPEAFGAKSKKYGSKGEMTNTLQSLSLRSNKLSFIPTDALEKLHQLRELSLADNKISVIKSSSFNSLLHLIQLDLSKNLIEMTAVDAFQDLQDLEILDLSSNSISVLSPSTFGHLSSLKQLHMNRNSIRKIHPLAFNHFTMLQELHLAVNRIDEIPDGVFALTASTLLLLDMSRNEIKKLKSTTFKGLKLLQSLKLSHNLLTQLFDAQTKTGVFMHLTSLKMLKLDSNRIEMLQDLSLEGLPQLQELTLTGNLIKVFPNVNLPSLERLDLSANLLSNINESHLQELPFLERLDLSDNVIIDVTANAFSECHRLRSLHLERNRLKTPYTTWMTSQRFRHKRPHMNSCAGHLAGNAWLCDCRTMAFARSVAKSRAATVENEKIYVNSDVMMCDGPEQFKGLTLTEFAVNSNLKCDVTISLKMQYWLWILFGSVVLFVIFYAGKYFSVRFTCWIGDKTFTKPNSKHL